MFESFTFGQEAIWASAARSIPTLKTREIRKMHFLRQFFRSFSVYVLVFAAVLQAQPTAHLTLGYAEACLILSQGTTSDPDAI
jgi:hypothetical protein